MIETESISDHLLSTNELIRKYKIDKIKRKLHYAVHSDRNIFDRPNYNEIFSPSDKSLMKLIILTLIEPCNIVSLICVTLLVILYIFNREEKQHLMVFIFTAIIMIVKTGFEVYEEYKINKLYRRKIDNYSSKIIVNNCIYWIPKEKLMIGDVLYLKKGDIVGADAILISANNLLIDSSSITGCHDLIRKSTKVSHQEFKFSNNVVLGSDKVVSGRGRAIVVGVGKNSELGEKSTYYKHGNNKETTLFTKIDDFFDLSMIFSALFAIICSIIAIIQKYSFASILTLIVSIFVATLPEGIFSVVKLQLNSSVLNLEKNGLFIRDVSAVEKLGFLSTILTNKKTINTLNFKIITYIYDGFDMFDIDLTFEENNKKNLKVIENIGYYCSLISESIKDRVHGLNQNLFSFIILSNIFNSFFVGYFRIPLNVKYRRVGNLSTVFVSFEDYNLIIVVGKVNYIASLCKYYKINKKIRRVNKDFVESMNTIGDKMANSGKESLILATRTHGKTEKCPKIKNLLFESLLFLEEQPDYKTPITVELLKASNVGFSILTKNKDVSNIRFCKDVLDIDKGNAISFCDFKDLSSQQQKNFLNLNNFIVYDCNTNNKMDLLDSLETSNKIVAFWGSEIQDSRFLNKSKLGICFESSGQICKASSSIIVKSQKIDHIIFALEEGRLFFVNFQKSVKYIMLHITPQLMAFLFYVVLGTPVSVSPILLLFLNYFVEIIPAKFFVYEEAENNLLLDNPLKEDTIIDENRYFLDINQNHMRCSSILSFRGIKEKLNLILSNSIYPSSNIIWAIIEAGLISGVGCMLAFYMVLYQNNIPVSKMFFSAEEYFLFGSPDLKLRNGLKIDFERQLEILFSGQSTFFIGLVICQFSNMLVCRRKGRYFFYKFFSNPRILIYSLIGIVISVGILFIEFFNDFLLVRRPMLPPLIFPTISAVLIVLIDTYRKRRLGTNN